MNSKNVVTKSKNVTYYVNREKKTVVAVIKCEPSTPILILDKVFDKLENANGNHNLMEMHFDNYYMSKAFINERYVGIAKCHDSDIFDEEFGKKLALARAKAKKADAVYRNFFKFIKQIYELNYMAAKKFNELYHRWIDSEAEVRDLLKSIMHLN